MCLLFAGYVSSKKNPSIYRVRAKTLSLIEKDKTIYCKTDAHTHAREKKGLDFQMCQHVKKIFQNGTFGIVISREI